MNTKELDKTLRGIGVFVAFASPFILSDIQPPVTPQKESQNCYLNGPVEIDITKIGEHPEIYMTASYNNQFDVGDVLSCNGLWDVVQCPSPAGCFAVKRPGRLSGNAGRNKSESPLNKKRAPQTLFQKK